MLYNLNAYNFYLSVIPQSSWGGKKTYLNTNQNKKAWVGSLTLLWQPSCTNAAPA